MFSIKKIVIFAFMLSLLIVSKLIAYPIPDLPNGLGNIFVLFEVIIIAFSFIFGVTKTLIVGIIYYGIIAWIGQPFFMREVTYVRGFENIIGVYFLDYLIPFVLLACSSVIYQKNPRYYMAILMTTLMVFSAYWSSVISGIIFWGSYSWNGWSVITYSIVANAIRYGVLMFVSIFFIACTISHLRTFLKNQLGDHYARY